MLDIDEDDIMATSTSSPAGAYTAPEFPTLLTAAAENQDHLEHAPEGVILADHAPEAVILAEHVVDRTKCIDCKDFYASVCGRCSSPLASWVDGRLPIRCDRITFKLPAIIIAIDTIIATITDVRSQHTP